MVAGGHQTVTPVALTYASVVSRDSVRIALTIAALNDLDVLSCDVKILTLPLLAERKSTPSRDQNLAAMQKR